MNDKYLLLGKDQGLKNDKIDEIKKTFRKESKNAIITKFYAVDKSDLKNFFEEVQGSSLFSSEKNLYIIENIEALNETEIKTFKSIIENTDDFIICTSEENKVSSSLEKCFSKDHIFIFYEMFENQKVPFIKQESAKRGLKIDDEAARLLLTLKDNDTLTLRKSLDEILLFINTEKLPPLITTTLLYEFLNHDREESGFTIASYIAKRDKRATLNAIKSIMGENSNALSSLFPSLIFSLLRIEEVAINKERGLYGDDIFNISDASGNSTVIRSPLEKNTINEFLRNYSRKDISRIVKLVIETESTIRENDSVLTDILLTKMVADI